MNKRVISAVLASGAVIATVLTLAPSANAISIAEEPTGAIVKHQGLPMPASGNCADVKDADFAWDTGLTGHWRKSYEPWGGPNGTWGFACIRTMAVNGGDWFFVGDGEGEFPAPPMFILLD